MKQPGFKPGYFFKDVRKLKEIIERGNYYQNRKQEKASALKRRLYVFLIDFSMDL